MFQIGGDRSIAVTVSGVPELLLRLASEIPEGIPAGHKDKFFGYQLFREKAKEPVKLSLYVDRNYATVMKCALLEDPSFKGSAVYMNKSTVRLQPGSLRVWGIYKNYQRAAPHLFGTYSLKSLRNATRVLLSNPDIARSSLTAIDLSEKPAAFFNECPSISFKVFDGTDIHPFFWTPLRFSATHAKYFGIPMNCFVDSIYSIIYLPDQDGTFLMRYLLHETLPEEAELLKWFIKRTIPLAHFINIPYPNSPMPEVYLRLSKKGAINQIHSVSGLNKANVSKHFELEAQPKDLYIFEFQGQKISKRTPHVALVGRIKNDKLKIATCLFHLLNDLFPVAGSVLSQVCKIVLRKDPGSGLMEFIWIVNEYGSQVSRAKEGIKHFGRYMIGFMQICGTFEPIIDVAWINPQTFDFDLKMTRNHPLPAYSELYADCILHFTLHDWDNEKMPGLLVEVPSAPIIDEEVPSIHLPFASEEAKEAASTSKVDEVQTVCPLKEASTVDFLKEEGSGSLEQSQELVSRHLHETTMASDSTFEPTETELSEDEFYEDPQLQSYDFSFLPSLELLSSPEGMLCDQRTLLNVLANMMDEAVQLSLNGLKSPMESYICLEIYYVIKGQPLVRDFVLFQLHFVTELTASLREPCHLYLEVGKVKILLRPTSRMRAVHELGRRALSFFSGWSDFKWATSHSIRISTITSQ